MIFKVETLEFELWIGNMYCSPGFSTSCLKKTLNDLVGSLHDKANVLILGDFNTPLNLLEDQGYIQLITGKLLLNKCFLHQLTYSSYCSGNSKSGIFGGRLSQAYARISDYSVDGEILYKSFTKSTHHPIAVILKEKIPR